MLQADQSGMLIVDAQTGAVHYANNSARRILGINEQTQLGEGKIIRRFFENDKVYTTLSAELEEKSSIVGFRCQMRDAKNALLNVELHASRFSQNGNPQYVISFTDLTDFLNSEKFLRNYDNKIRNLEKALNASSLVSITDGGGTIIYANDRFCEVSKFTRNELLGQNHNIINSGYHPREFMQNLWATIKRGEIWHGDIRNRAKDGTYYWVENTIVPFLNKRGEPYQFFAIRQDITQRKKNALELEQSREALLQAQALAKLGSWEWYPDADEPVWSPEMFAIYGVDPKGKPVPFAEVSKLFTPESWEILAPAVQNTYESGIPYQLECEIIRADGSHGWIISSGVPLYADDGKIKGLRGTVQDVTERKLNDERNRLIINAMPDLIFVMNHDGMFLDYHAAELTRLAYKPDFFLGKSFREIFDHDLAMKMETALVNILHGSKLEHIEYSLPFSGNESYYEATFTPLDRDRCMIVVRDTTARKKNENLMREQATLLDKASDAILVRDLQNVIRYWNEGAVRMYGYTKEEAIGNSVRSLLYAEHDSVDAATQQVLDNGEFSGELEQLTKNGSKLTALVRWTLLRDEHGKPKSILAINSDVTERRKLEQQFLRAQRLESIGTLAGGIAHDLNNVMTPIMLAAAVLKTGNLSADQLELINMIESSVRHGTAMVKQVLSFARGAEGNPRPMQMSSLISEIEPIVRDTFPRNISLQTQIPVDLWSVKADKTQLHQVLMNLAVNARDAMPDGGTLTISAENRTLDAQYAGMQMDAAPGHYVVIRIEDTGTGMPPDVLEKVFEPFFTTKEHGKGTGLGLSTSMAIMKGHGGFMRVYSEPGRGTRFHLYLPALSKVDEESAVATSESLPRGNGELILVVDDEAPVRTITCQTLEAFGYATLPASDGAEAVAIFAEHKNKVALLLTDMMMPVLDGPGAISVIQKMQPKLPIIAVSGLAANGKLSALQAADKIRFLAKPFSAEQLLQAVRLSLNTKPSV
ncbi:MAG: PAS domain S-box protein [Turneriella sp.]